LKPFAPVSENIQLAGTVSRHEDRLEFEYRLSGQNRQVQDCFVKGQWTSWERADELWRTTCFEAFWGVPGQETYYELNLSPAKQKWNCYRFAGYREPQPPKTSEDFELIGVECGSDFLKASVQAKIPLPKLEMNLCAVIRTPSGISYFSWNHVDQKADFHARSCFRYLLT
jgi:hypothetical protein